MKSSRAISNKLIRNLMDEHEMILQALTVLRIVTERVEKRRPVELRDFEVPLAVSFGLRRQDSSSRRGRALIRHFGREITAINSSNDGAANDATCHGPILCGQNYRSRRRSRRGERGWRKQFVGSAQSYDVLLTCHICSEDHNVFPAIDRLIDRHGLRTKSESQSMRKQKDRLEKALRRMALRYGDMVHGVENIHRCERNTQSKGG